MRNIIILILLIIYSCTEPHPVFQTNYLLINESNHEIEIIKYNREFIDTLSLLNENDIIEISYIEKGIVNPPPFIADSVKVIYDDTISIIHFRIQGEDIMKNILLDESWIENQKSESEYTYEYIFTEEDYLEAKEQ